MVYEILNTLLLVGAIQGVIFSGFAFFSKKYQSLSTTFLGLLILTFSYNLLQYYLALSGISDMNRLFFYFYIPFSTLFLVLFYLYVKTYLYPDKKLKRTDYLLFLPFLIAFTGSIVEKVGYRFIEVTPDYVMFFNYYRMIHEVFSLVYSIILCILSFRMIQKFENEQRARKGQKSKIRFSWLKTITLILLGLCFYWILPLYLELRFLTDLSTQYFYLLWVGLAITIYLLGHIGLFQKGILRERMQIEAQKDKIDFKEKIDNAYVEPEIIVHKSDYINEFERIVKHEKGFLQNDITLDSIGEDINLSRSYLSRLINVELETSFTDYVNKLRVLESLKMLNNPEFEHYNLLSIGLEAGFNSKSTFYNSFKKFMGVTPTEYMKKGYSHKFPHKISSSNSEKL